MTAGFTTGVRVRWSDIDMYQHINHATMVTILEEARVDFLREPFTEDIETIGLLIHEVRVLYKGQLRLIDSPLQVTMWTKRLRAVDFTLGYEVRSVSAAPDQTGGDRRDPVGRGAHRGAAAGPVVADPPRVSAALPPGVSRLCVPDATHRRDLAVFADRALRLDPAAVIRVRSRADGLLGAWVLTGFDVLAVRVVAGTAEPSDLTCAADGLRSGLDAPDGSGCFDPGFPMDSAWRALLPPENGFVHLDDVPAAVLADLARRGAELAREHAGPAGPPASLLDQEVLRVSAGTDRVDVPMRCVLALAAMGFAEIGFAPEAAGEVVRVRVMPTWLRVDARFGSVFRRRGDPALLVR